MTHGVTNLPPRRALQFLATIALFVATILTLGTIHWARSPFAGVLVASDGTIAQVQPLPEWGTSEFVVPGVDKLMAIDATPVLDGHAAADLLDGYLTGDRVRLTLLRHDALRTLTVAVRRPSFPDAMQVVGPFLAAGWLHLALAIWLLRHEPKRQRHLATIYCLAGGTMILSQICSRTGHALDGLEPVLLQTWILGLFGIAGSFLPEPAWRGYRWAWLVSGFSLAAIDLAFRHRPPGMWLGTGLGFWLATSVLVTFWAHAAGRGRPQVVAQQARLALAGAAAGLIPACAWQATVTQTLLAGHLPVPGMPNGSLLAILALPLVLAAVFARSATLDPASIIRRLLVSTFLAICLVALYLLGTSTLGAAWLAWLDLDPDVGIIAVGISLSLFVLPLKGACERVVDRVCFPHRRSREALVEAFADQAMTKPGLLPVQTAFLETVRAVCQPSRLGFWLADSAGERFRLVEGPAGDADLPGAPRDLFGRWPAPEWHLTATANPVAAAFVERGYHVVMPLRLQDTVIGLLALGERDGAVPYGPDERRWLGILVTEAALALHNRLLLDEKERHITRLETLLQLYNDAETRASIDGLTGLTNRPTFERRLAEALSRFTRYGEVFSLLLFDLDRFKAINDRYGHLVGDTVLKAVSHCLQTEARESDCVARYGGEEFVIIVAHTDSAGAAALAERLREAIQDAVIPVAANQSVRVTVSAGIAGPHAGDTMTTDILDRADKALYDAKLAGRNRVVTAPNVDDGQTSGTAVPSRRDGP